MAHPNTHKNNLLIGASAERRRFCHWLLAPALTMLVPNVASAGTQVSAARLWPAQEYTRLTLELAAPIKHEMLLVKNPDRLVLDLEGVDLTGELRQLATRVAETDPYIQGVRVGINRPGVLRLVLDLKQEVAPQIFALPPVAGYGHRLVIDLHPTQPVDPLLALLEETARNERAAGERAEKRETKVAEKAEPAPRPEKAPERGAKDSRLLTVAIDPGHGGEDPGAIGHKGTYEKTVTLAIGKKLKKLIDAEPNMRAVLTRDGDYFVPLRERVQKARKVNADLFISVHADAFLKPTVRGSSVFVLSENGATSAAAKWLAQKENAADLIGGVNLKVDDPILAKTLLDLSQTATINDSLKLGRAVLEQIGEVNDLHKGHVEQAGFAVLKAPDIPSILVETAFISNPDEEKRLRDAQYQEQMAASIVDGVKSYFSRNPPVARTRLASS